MPNVLIELKQNFSEYDQFAEWFSHGSYYNTTLELCQPWQLREALSFYFNDPILNTKLTNIVDSIKDKRINHWPTLDLVDEAIIQNHLRSIGIELVAQNTWPTNTNDLLLISKKINKIAQFKYNVVDSVLSNRYSFYASKWLNYKYAIVYVIFILCLFDWSLLVTGLMLGYVCWMFADVIRHDYLEHQYLLPKNSIIRTAINAFIYFVVPATNHDQSHVIISHQKHHRFWKTDKDEFTQRVLAETIPGITDYDLTLFKRPVDPSMFQYMPEIRAVVLLIMALEFGLTAPVFFIILPMMVVNLLAFQHDWYFYKFGERDYPWMFLLALNQAWHYSHHKTFKQNIGSWSKVFNGPTWVRYINPQYYFVRLLFKLKHSEESRSY